MTLTWKQAILAHRPYIHHHPLDIELLGYNLILPRLVEIAPKYRSYIMF